MKIVREHLALCFLALLAVVGVVWLLLRLLPSRPPQLVDEEPSEPAWFENVTEGSGIAFTYMNGEDAGHLALLESLGGGVALLDYDRDGRLDVFFTGGGFFGGDRTSDIRGHPCRLYRNLGNWKFVDVTREVGLDGPWAYTHGVAVADYDRDGFPDLAVTAYGRVSLFHNEARPDGTRRFVDVSKAVGLEDAAWCTSAAWGDIDGDGFPDLYVCHYCDWSFENNPPCEGLKPGVLSDVCSPDRFKPQVHALFLNERGKRFRNVAIEHSFPAGYGLGVAIADFNDDRRPDIYVANDTTNNFLYYNRAGKLVETGLLAGVAIDNNARPNASMGVAAADYAGTGKPSIFVTNYQKQLHALYRNDGAERFSFVSPETGFADLPTDLVGFGTGFLDFDRDGWEDLVFANGHVVHQPSFGGRVDQPTVLMRNEDRGGRRVFRDASGQAGAFFRFASRGRGVAIGDLDNDGAPDFVVSHIGAPAALLRNRIADRTNGNWIGLRLTGRGDRDVVGSTAIVEMDGRTLTRFAQGGGSYLSSGDPRLLFGLGEAKAIRRITVKWSWGEVQTWDNLTPGRYWNLIEGSTAAQADSR